MHENPTTSVVIIANKQGSRKNKFNFKTLALYVGLFFVFGIWFNTQNLNKAQAAAPAYQAVGTADSGFNGTIAPAWPSHLVDDVALLFVEAAGGDTTTLTTPNGFTEVANSPQFTGTGTTGTRISIYWARATSTSMAAPVIADGGDHNYGIIVTFRGVINSGNPVDVTGGGSKASASTSVTATGVTTNVNNDLIVVAITKDLDATAAFTSAQANAALTGIAERTDAGTTSGGGGGLSVTTGVKAAAGATGSMTATVTSSINAFLTVALKPAVITISGTCDAYDETTDCGDTGTVAVAVNGVLQAQTQATVAGTWSITGVEQPTSGNSVIVFIDGAANADRAAAITKYDGSGDIDLVRLYKEHLTIGTDTGSANSGQSIANTDLDDYDTTNDADVFYDVLTSGTCEGIGSFTGLCVDGSNTSSQQELLILSGNTLAPAGNVQTHDVTILGTWTAGAHTYTVTGSWNDTGTFTPSTSTVTFTATGTGETITTTGSSFNNLTFNGSGGGWTLQDSVTISGTLTVTAGNFDAGSGTTITLSKTATSLSIAGTFTANTSTVQYTGATATITATTYYNLILGGTGTYTLPGTAWTINNNLTVNSTSTVTKGSGVITFNGSANTVTITNNSNFNDLGTISIGNGSAAKVVNLAATTRVTKVTITTGATLNINSSNTLEITGTGAGASRPIVNNGTLNSAGGTIRYMGTSATDLGSDVTYNNLLLNPAGTVTYTLGTASSQTININGTLTIGNGSNAVTVTGATYNPAVNVGGVMTINTTAIYTSGSGTLTFSSTGTPLVVSGTFTASTNNTVQYTGATATTTVTTYYNLTLGGTGTYTLPDSAWTMNGSLVITTGATVTKGTGVITFNGSANTVTITGNAINSDLGTITVGNGVAAKVVNIASNVKLTAVTVTAAATLGITSTNTLTLTGTGTPLSLTGAFTPNSGTVQYTGTTATVTATTYYSITLGGTGTYTLPASGWNVNGDFTISTGATSTAGAGVVTFAGSANTVTITNSGTNSSFSAAIGTIAIGNGSLAKVVNLGSNITINKISITAGATFSLNGTKNLTLIASGTGSSRPLINSGTFTASTGAVIYYQGNFATTEISTVTSDNVTYYDLQVRTSALETFYIGTASSQTLTVTGTFSGGAGVSPDASIYNPTLNFNILNLGTGITLVGGSGTINVTGDMTIFSGGSFTKGSGTLVFKAGTSQSLSDGNATKKDLGAVRISTNGGATTVNMSSSIKMTSLLVDSSQTLVTGANTLNIVGSGTGGSRPIVNSGTITTTSGTIEYTSTSTTDIGADVTYNNLTIDPAGTVAYQLGTATTQTITINGNLTIGDASNALTLDANTYDPTVTVVGNVTITASSIYTASSDGTHPLTIGDDLTNNGTFTHNNGMVVFNTAANVSTIAGANAITFYNFKSITPGKVISFKKATTGAPVYTIAGTMTVTGSSGVGNTVTIQSDTPGSQWLVQFSTAQSSISYATIIDSGCNAGTADANIGGMNNTDGGGNGSCWIIISLTNVYWVGGAGNWSDATNHWATSSNGTPGAGNLPISSSNVHFDSSSCSGTCAIAINSSITVADFDANESQATITASGTVAATGNMTITSGTFQTAEAADGSVTVTGTLLVDTSGTFIVRYKSLSVPTSAGAGQTITAATLTINGNMNADSQGFTYNAGPGAGSYNSGGSGGGYGGVGGSGSGAAAAGVKYGSATSPIALGSGGGTNGTGAKGAGAIKLVVSGTTTVAGTLSAIGGADTFPRGGGSGGSIWISSGTIAGAGTISAAGGVGGQGGGGGGRIDISGTTNSFTGTFNVDGGITTGTSSGNLRGRAGTIAFPAAQLSSFTLSSNLTLGSDITYAFGNLTVTNSSTLTIDSDPTAGSGNGTGGTITATNITVDAGSFISVDGRGFGLSSDVSTVFYGPGSGSYNSGGSGGGHGGKGGATSASGGVVYGSITSPTSIGSAGGSNGIGADTSGGGAVTITVSSALTVNGTISANGTTPGSVFGGGAGGSLNITTATISGSGTIRANGASSSYGAGGGGRVAVKLTSGSSFGSVVITAYGGAGSVNNGAAGTVYTETSSQTGGVGILTVNNNNVSTASGTDTRISSLVTGTSVGSVVFTTSKAGKMTIDSGQTLTTIATGTSLNIGTGGSLTNNGTLSLSGTTFTNSGTFASGGSSTIIYTGQGDDSAVTLLSTTYENLTVNNAGTTFSLPATTTVNSALGITAGTLDQGATYSLTSGAVTVGASGTWSNTGTGDITLSGDVANAGVITIKSNNSTSCSGTDDIVIASSAAVQRTWSGAGTFNIYNVSVSYQTGSITVYNSTNTSNNGWTFSSFSCIANAYWVGGTGNWSDAATHWAASSGGAAGAGNLPVSTTNVFFNSSSGTGTVTIDTASITVADFNNSTANITIATSSNGITITGDLTVTGTISGATAITLNSSSKSITGAASATISSPVVLGATRTVAVASGAFNMSGIISDGGSAYGLIKTGSAELNLSGVNTFTGGLNVKAGTVRGSTSANAFGANASTITLGDTSGSTNTFLIGYANVTFANPISVASGNTGVAKISGSGFDFTLSGAISLSNNLTFETNFSNLTVTGGITGTGNLILNTSDTSVYGVTISTTTVNNTGTITNSGTGTATNTISTVIGTNVTGVIQNSSTSALALTTATNTFTSGVTIRAGILSGNVAASFGNGGTITIGHSSGSANATLSGNAAVTFTNPITVASGNSGVATIRSSGANATFSGAVTMNHALTLAPSANNLTMSGGFSGSANLTLATTGVGTITLSTVSVNNTGTITNSGSGSGTSTIFAAIGSNVTSVIQNSSTSQLTLFPAAPLTLSGSVVVTSGTLTNSTALTIGTTLTVSDGGTFTQGAAAVTVNGNTTIGGGTSGVFTASTSGQNLLGNLTLAVGSIWTKAASGTLVFKHGSGGQTITDSTASKQDLGNVQISVNGTNTTLTLASNAKFTTLTIDSSQTFDQGASFNITTGTVTIASSGTWSNTGTGDIVLSGNVSNAGIIILNSNNGSQCVNGANDIVITSSSGGVQRTWSGAGTFTLYNLDVTDMLGSVTAYTSTLTNTAWTVGTCSGNVSGFVYNDETGSPAVWTGCSGTSNISMSINGAAKISTTCNASTGVFTFAAPTYAANDIIAIYLDTAGGDKGVAYTRAVDSSTSISGIILTKNVIWLSYDVGSNITNANINVYDQSNDADIPVASNGTNITGDSGVELHIDTSKTFAPGGNVTVASLHIKGTYTGGATETLTTTGDITIASGGSIDAPNDIVLGGNLTNNGIFHDYAGSGFSNGYSYSRAITIDHTKIGSTDLTDYPMLVSGTYSYLATVANAGKVTNSSGYDIVFASDSTGSTSIPYEREKYVSTTGEVVFWVKVPSISHTVDTVIYMFYGKASVSTDQSSASSTWRSSFKRVWHVDDGTTLSGTDSTGTGNLTNSSATATSAKVNGGVNVVGASSQYMSGTRDSSIPSPTAAFTVRMWINSDGQGGAIGRYLSWYNGTNSIQFGRLNSGDYMAIGTTGDVAPKQTLSSGTAGTGLRRLVWTFDGASTYKTYLNGVDVSAQVYGGSDITLYSGNSTTVYLGQRGNGSFATGIYDEIWLETGNVAVSEALADYNNQNSPSTFYAVGSESAGGGAGNPAGTFTVAPNGSSSTITGTNGVTFYNFTVNAAAGAGKSVIFKSANNYIFEGTFNVAGQNGSLLALSATTATSQWLATFKGAAILAYVSIIDAGCLNSNSTRYASTLVSLGNNSNCWVIITLGGGGSGGAAPVGGEGSGGGTPVGGGTGGSGGSGGGSGSGGGTPVGGGGGQGGGGGGGAAP